MTRFSLLNSWYARYTLPRSARLPSSSLSSSLFPGDISPTYRSMSSGVSSAFANALIPSIMVLIRPNALLPTSTLSRPKSSMWLIAHTTASAFSITPPPVSSPVSSSLSSSTFFANEWNVPTSMFDMSIPNRSSRLRISPAALSVNVRHSISSELALPGPTRWRTLSVSTMVLPLPGPALMSSGPPSYSTAPLCSSSSFTSMPPSRLPVRTKTVACGGSAATPPAASGGLVYGAGRAGQCS